MKVLIVNFHLDTGGIRQSLLNLLQNLDYEDMEVDLQLLKYSGQEITKYPQLQKVNVCPPIKILNAYLTPYSDLSSTKDKIVKIFFTGLAKIIGRKLTMSVILFLVKKTKEYDIAISFSNDIWNSDLTFFGGCNDFVNKKSKAQHKIGWIHSDPYKLGFTNKILKKTYKNFDTIINVSQDCKKKFDEIIPEFKHKSKVVYNFIKQDSVKKNKTIDVNYNENTFNIVTVARLNNDSKRIDRIIYCCKKLKELGVKDFNWHIVGDGPDREFLNSLSREMNTDDVIFFEGNQNDPYPFMEKADIFVLVSDYEAYGMAITESLYVGTPVISTKYPAVYEVLMDNKNGIITDFTVESICEAIITMINNTEKLDRMRNFIQNNKNNNNVALMQFNKVICELTSSSE